MHCSSYLHPKFKDFTVCTHSWGHPVSESIKTVKEAQAALPPPPSTRHLGSKRYCTILHEKLALMKASNLSRAASACRTTTYTLHIHGARPMPYQHRYFIILYFSLFMTLMPEAVFSLRAEGTRGRSEGNSVGLFSCLNSLPCIVTVQ